MNGPRLVKGTWCIHNINVIYNIDIRRKNVIGRFIIRHKNVIGC